MKKLIHKLLGEPVWFMHDPFKIRATKGRLIRTSKHLLVYERGDFYVVNGDGTGPENCTWWPR